MRVPAIVMTAGIVWIVFGSLKLLMVPLSLLLAAMRVPAFVCVAVLDGLIGGGFVAVGVQTVQGKARDTLGNGFGSIIFGILSCGSGAYRLIALDQAILGNIDGLVGAGLIGAGICALIGRDDYKAGRRRRKRRRRRSAER